MPKFKEKKIDNAPPIDWLWAAILERKAQYGWDLQTMATAGGTSYAVMRRLIRESPWNWPKDVRENVCREFRLEMKFGPANLSLKEGK